MVYNSVLYSRDEISFTHGIKNKLEYEWNKKQKQGWHVYRYRRKLDRMPMRCGSWCTSRESIQYPALISPIMKGERVQYDPRKEGLLGRFGYTSQETRLYTFIAGLDMPLDGMIFHPSWYDGTVQQEDRADHLLLLHVFDVPDPDEPSYPKRIEKFLKYLQELGYGNDQLRCVPIGKVEDEQDAERCIKVIKEMNNVTGAVVRNMQSPYIYNSISTDVLKIDFN